MCDRWRLQSLPLMSGMRACAVRRQARSAGRLVAAGGDGRWSSSRGGQHATLASAAV